MANLKVKVQLSGRRNLSVVAGRSENSSSTAQSTPTLESVELGYPELAALGAFRENHRHFSALYTSPFQLGEETVKNLISTSSRGPRYPTINIHTKPMMPPWAFSYVDCDALEQSVPVPRHPSVAHIRRLCDFVCTVPLHWAQDTRLTRLSEEEASTPGGWDKIRLAMEQGTMVVIQGCQSQVSGLDFNPDNPTYGVFGSLGVRVKPQDVIGVCSPDPSHPMDQAMPLRDFLSLAGDPMCILDLLDCNHAGMGDRPAWVQALAADRRLQPLFQVENVKADFNRYTGWTRFAHPFAASDLHQDSAGFGTYLIGVSGRQLWVYFGWEICPAAVDWKRHRECILQADWFGIEYSRQPPWRKGDGTFDQRVYADSCNAFKKYRVGRFFVIDVVPNMAIIQPANTAHLVYSPEPSIVTGGHFVCWESMHAMMVACRNENLAGPSTNDPRPSRMHILCQMALTLGNWEGCKLQSVDMRGHTSQQIVCLSMMLFYPTLFEPRRMKKSTYEHEYASLGDQNDRRLTWAVDVLNMVIENYSLRVPGHPSATGKDVALTGQDLVHALENSGYF